MLVFWVRLVMRSIHIAPLLSVIPSVVGWFLEKKEFDRIPQFALLVDSFQYSSVTLNNNILRVLLFVVVFIFIVIHPYQVTRNGWAFGR